MVGTLSHQTGVENGVDLAHGVSALRVKAYATDVVLDVFIVCRDVPCRRGDKVERASVGREHGVVFVVVFRHHCWVEHDLMSGGMIDEHVGGLVKDFDALAADGMEALMSLVGAIGNPLS